MIIFSILFITTTLLAYANGANDNFKGVATLFGSNTTNYRKAIRWATITTLLGSLCSIILAEKLLKNFSGKGLVPVEVTESPEFLISVAAGAALTVLFTALRGLPISTTHSLVGALLGSGFVAIGNEVNFDYLGKVFFLPLLVSPFVAIVFSYASYLLLKKLTQKTGLTRNLCFCIGLTENYKVNGAHMAMSSSHVTAVADTSNSCEASSTSHVFSVTVRKVLDGMHFISAGIVCFARGLNDTPKIVALLIAIPGLSIHLGMLVIAVGMALGGLMNAHRIAETIGKKITPMKHEQGFVANVITGLLVIFASRMGVPVSTTHVSVGSIFGISLITGEGNKKVISTILWSWLLTLPVAAILSGLFFLFLNI